MDTATTRMCDLYERANKIVVAAGRPPLEPVMELMDIIEQLVQCAERQGYPTMFDHLIGKRVPANDDYLSKSWVVRSIRGVENKLAFIVNDQMVFTYAEMQNLLRDAP